MSDYYLTLEEIKINKSLSDGSMYKTYITNFFSFTKAHHDILNLYDVDGNIQFVELFSIVDCKIDSKTNEAYIRVELEFLDSKDMDKYLHKPLYFKEPEWFHDLTNEEINQIDCIFNDYEPFGGPLVKSNHISICMDGTIHTDDEIIHVSESMVNDFFDEIEMNLGNERTYKPLLCGDCSSTYILHLKSGKVIEYSGNYALCDGTSYGCERYTKKIVDDLLKQVVDSF